MTTDKFLPYGRQSIDSFDITAVSRALQKDLITRGPAVEEFEQAIAEYCGALYAVAFCNGSQAMAAAFQAAQVGPSDRVYTSANTFVGSINGAVQRGAQPVFLDIDRSHGGISMEEFEDNINAPLARGRALFVPVHLAGIALDMREIDDLIALPNTMIIEDAAHALGSRYPSGERVGSCEYSAMTMFSFHPVKTITTGEGGMVTTNDPELYERLLRARNSGIERRPEHMTCEASPWAYEVQELALNSHMTEFQAALGLSQLSKLELFVKQRRERVMKYRSLLRDVDGIRLFDEAHDERTAYHLFVVQIDFEKFGVSRQELMETLKNQGIGSQVHYIPLYRHPVFAEPVDASPYFPEMELYYEQALSLPLYPDLSMEDIERVVSTLLKALPQMAKA